MLFSFFATEAIEKVLCPEASTHIQGKRLRKWCDSQGRLIQVEDLFNEKYGDKISRSYKIEEGKIVNQKIFNLEQIQVQELDYKNHEGGSITETLYPVEPFRAYIISKSRFKKNDEGRRVNLESWHFQIDKKEKTSLLVSSVLYHVGTKIPFSKTFYKKDGIHIDFMQEYIYKGNIGSQINDVKIVKVRQYDAFKQLQFEYSSQGPVTFEELYEKTAEPEAKPLGVVVIDSGFETDHPALINHWYQNSVEIFDGKDNDGNGLIDDVYGYYYSWDKSHTNNIREVGYVEAPQYYYYSHGTHVASLAMEGISEWSLAAFGGDPSSPKLLDHAKSFIQNYGAPFVNMSIVYGDSMAMGPSMAPLYDSLRELIYKNKQSLFFVAAPNVYKDIDLYPDYPASYPYENLIVVSSIDQSDWADVPDPVYATPVKDAAYGIENVDIYAPGSNVLAAYFGKTYRRLSGNSMASPKALNAVVKVAEKYPTVSTKMLKQIFLLSAYIPNIDEPMSCLSGGVAYPERFEKAVEFFVSGMDPREAVIEVRRLGPDLVGESKEDFYFQKLNEFWKKRNLISE